MEIEDHGGGCCGIYHVQDFFSYHNEDDLENAVEEINAPRTDCYCLECEELNERLESHSFAVEAILTDDQLEERDGYWSKALKKAGFILTVRWLNPNSGNYCNQFVLCDNEPKDSPFNKEW